MPWQKCLRNVFVCECDRTSTFRKQQEMLIHTLNQQKVPKVAKHSLCKNVFVNYEIVANLLQTLRIIFQIILVLVLVSATTS